MIPGARRLGCRAPRDEGHHRRSDAQPFEARHPRDKAGITEADGTVHHGPVVKGMHRIIIETDEGTRHEYSVPRSVHVNAPEASESVEKHEPRPAAHARRPPPTPRRRSIVAGRGAIGSALNLPVLIPWAVKRACGS